MKAILALIALFALVGMCGAYGLPVPTTVPQATSSGSLTMGTWSGTPATSTILPSLTAHVDGCGGIASDDSLLDILPDGYSYDSPADKYVTLKKGWLRTDTDGFVTWDGPVQTKTWTLYYAVKVMTPAGTLQSRTAKIVMMPCV